MSGKPRVHEAGTRIGWLYNLYVTTVSCDGSQVEREVGGQKQDPEGGGGSTTEETSAIRLLLRDLDGDVFECSLQFQPYFLVATVEGHEHEVELGISSAFQAHGLTSVKQIEKEDLGMVNHLSGKKRTYLKLSFLNTNALVTARSRMESAVRRFQSIGDENPLESGGGSGISFGTDGFFGFQAETDAERYASIAASNKGADKNAPSWMSWVCDLREFDMKYHVRVAIDMGVYVGLWYEVSAEHGKVYIDRCDDSKYPPAMPKICAFDIETTKAPLKFPQPEVDQIYMISYMLDTRGFLIVNREIVSDDIAPFEYTPKPEYEGHFETFNEPNEKALLRRFYDEMKIHQPNVYVTYNGDYFDFPFIHARSVFHGMNMRNEIGFSQGAEGATLNKEIPHLDCFYWVKRDSYLPQGSQGLKAVTKYKLGYEPIEVDPEEMLPLAQSHPQRMASYSVSDAVSTYYLYMKYVHPFIYSLCTVIPMPPDEVLRKGSGTLCESLLCVQAYAKNVVFPNKQVEVKERFHEGHLIDTETYIGGRVEALKSGVFRSDIPIDFDMTPEVFTMLLEKLDEMLKFAIEVENKTSMSEITNYDEIKSQIVTALESLRSRPKRSECPLIYHLDVGAMYPNIILTNRLQPPSMVTPEVCAGCCFYTPDDQNNCRREMTWVWRGEMFTAGRHEFARVKAQLESESFAATAVAKIDQGATTKKNYGNRKGNVLEGTAYEKKERDWTKKDDNAGGNGYRKMNDRQKREAEEALLDQAVGGGGGGGGSDGSGDEDEDGNKKFHRLGENTQHNFLKKRVGEYSRKAYGKTHLSKEMYKTHTVCQRENTFFVDTVRLFRDRRYEYKAQLKRWKGFLDKAKTPAEIKEGKSRCVQMESLQLAHKCILNSFYGYVMRKGSRWYSMEMAGIVTYLGATLIKMARTLVQQLGVTLELDTDGIWCCLPKSFPDEFVFTTTNPKKNISISYPCVMLNKDVQDRYTNAQYQDIDTKNPGAYIRHDECSIYFEVDGPYLSMILPASKEEGKTIKKRYAVFNPDGKLAELKGFELKRRGELMLIKDFQSLVFKRFLAGTSLEEAYKSAAEVANNALDLLYNKGEGYDDEEVMEKLTESSNMSRRLAEYPESQKSLALTAARRIAEFLGPQMVKDKGLACKFVISRTPIGKPVTDRAIPLNIFKADPAIRIHFLRKWVGDVSLPSDVGLKAILDWDYYIGRFQGTVQKIICIPAAFQGVLNPVPRVKHPEWLAKRIATNNSKFKQVSLESMLGPKVSSAMKDLEDFGGTTSKKVKASTRVNIIDSDDENEQEEAMCGAAQDEEYDERAAEVAREQRERDEEEKEAARAFSRKYFSPSSATPMDNTFFTDLRFNNWLDSSKQSWTHRARLRKEIIGGMGNEDGTSGQLMASTARGRGAASGTMDSMLVDSHSKALSTTWNVLEVRAVPGVEHQVTIFAILNGSLQRFVVDVTRTVTVDMHPDAKPLPNSRELHGKTLPRHREAGRLFEVTLPQKGQRDALDHLLYSREDVRGVYEDHIDNATRAVLQCGAMCSVISQLHLSRRHKRGEFALDELEGSASSAKYWSKMPSTAFIFHVTSPDGQSGVIGALFRPSNTAVVCVVQANASQRPTFNWKSLVTSALEAVDAENAAANEITLDVRVEFPTDRRAAFGIINRAIGEASESATHAWRPSLAIVQSPMSLEEIASSQGIPALQNLPIIRTAGSDEDLGVIAANPLTWQRPLARRMLLRFFAAYSWIEERAAVASVMNVPLCNLDHDINSSAMDFVFMRSLKRHSHILWNPLREGYCYESVEERPKEVVTSGSHHVWATEFSISQAEVVAVLFSQMVQEGDDPRAHILCDGGVTSHFHVLRDLLSELYSQATQRKEAAASLLLSFPRWLRDTVSLCYEPNIVVLVSRLVHRALTALLVRITKLGGRIARATTETVVVVSSKHSLQDATGFANFLTSSLKDHPMLNHLNLRPYRYWCPLLLLDHMDYAGLYIAAEQAPALSQLRPSELPSPGLMTFEYSCTVWSRLPASLRDLLVGRLRDYCTLTAMIKRNAVDIVDKDITATLASKGEKLADVFTSKMTTELDERWQLRIIEDVNNIVVQRIQLVENSFPSIRGTSDTAAAIEYAKVLITMVSLGSTVSPSLWKIKNNCLRLCNISPFAPAATFVPDKRERATYVRTYCGFCSEQVLLHVGVGTGPNDWKCSGCASPFRPAAIEGHFLTEINRVIRRYLQQDFTCVKCKQPAVSRVNKSVCCSTLQPKLKDTQWVLDTFQFIGDLHKMDRLLSAVKAARYMVV